MEITRRYLASLSAVLYLASLLASLLLRLCPLHSAGRSSPRFLPRHSRLLQTFLSTSPSFPLHLHPVLSLVRLANPSSVPFYSVKNTSSVRIPSPPPLTRSAVSCVRRRSSPLTAGSISPSSPSRLTAKSNSLASTSRLNTARAPALALLDARLCDLPHRISRGILSPLQPRSFLSPPHPLLLSLLPFPPLRILSHCNLARTRLRCSRTLFLLSISLHFSLLVRLTLFLALVCFSPSHLAPPKFTLNLSSVFFLLFCLARSYKSVRFSLLVPSTSAIVCSLALRHITRHATHPSVTEASERVRFPSSGEYLVCAADVRLQVVLRRILILSAKSVEPARAHTHRSISRNRLVYT